ncbi:hypothetical protein [Thermoleptolyngbya sp. PKUAC-SCTB121]|nr:hypothetical protein [Thermoleptolyngbya sp. PKUAC-SCTB121]
MRRTALVMVLGTLALWLGSCRSAPEEPAATAPTDPNAPAEPGAVGDPNAPADPNAAADPNAMPADPAAVPAAPATAPTTATAPSPGLPAGTLPPELIASTNPQARVQEVQRNRPDPFAQVTVTPVVVESPNRNGATTRPFVTPAGQGVRVPPLATGRVPSLPGGQAGTGGAATGIGAAGTGTPSGTGQLAPIPNLTGQTLNGPAQRPAPPPPPQPTMARAVKVMGVIQIGNTAHAIVQAPNEPTSRYVRVGQRLSNGEVLVKRIEMNRGSEEPVVVLEQYGIEVPIAVGQGGPPPVPGA